MVSLLLYRPYKRPNQWMTESLKYTTGFKSQETIKIMLFRAPMTQPRKNLKR